MPINNRDNERFTRSLAKSQSTLDDIDNLLDNKPFPRDEANEARLTKQWGPDPDPVDPDNPTAFRFQHPNDSRNPGDMRNHVATYGRAGNTYSLPNNDRHDRIDMFGEARFISYRENELHIDEDGPLHGLAKPIYAGNSLFIGDELERDHMYMSREEKQQNLDDPNSRVISRPNVADPPVFISNSNGPIRSTARTRPARSRTLNRNPTGSQRLPIRQAAQRAIEGSHSRAGGRGTGDYSFRTEPAIDTVGHMDDADSRRMGDSNPNHIIYSYNTPIAWSQGEGENRVWTVPHKKHSRSTSRHQSAIRSALWNRGFTPDHQIPGVAIYRRSEPDGRSPRADPE
jgi:hypothetical protein